MGVVERRSLSRMVELGRAYTPTLVLYDDAGTALTPSAGTLTIYDGSEVILAETTVDTLSTTSSHSVAASVTTGRDPSDQYLEVWTMTTSEGGVQEFPVSGYLCRRLYRPAIIDTDLTDRHSELATFLSDLDISTYQKYRDEANVELQLDLLTKGRRPWLIFDREVARRMHIYLSLALIFEDFQTTVGSGKYGDSAKTYRDRYTKLLESENFRYDAGRTGKIDASSREAASGPVTLTAGPRGGGRRYRRGGL